MELEKQREAELLEERLTGGIHVCANLSPIPDTSEAEDDRVILPESFIEQLSKQNAFSMGPAAFRLRHAESGQWTHCGVREFTASEGNIILPEKVVQSLFGSDGIPSGAILELKYVRLPKVKSVKLQPLENRFYSIENVKLMLEDNLKHHTTLSIEDIVTVWFRGQKYHVKVSAMQPEDRGSLIDTDVEVDLDESVEYKQHLEKEAAQSANVAPSGHVLGSSSGVTKTSVPAESTPSVFQFPKDAQTASVPPMPSTEDVPLEPEAGLEGVVTCKFRISGGNITRRFNQSEPWKYVFAFLRSEAALGKKPQLSTLCEAGKVLTLTTRFPNRVFIETDDMIQNGATLSDSAVTSAIDFIVANV